ncbi:XRE family transcriptional regulator [Burkholderia pyrrocinia]|nr:XRE family transcriptional regulator [Burkholderia pyrrocinia]EKS9893602.1 XRE family transcriptional regulator [Burkholderia pyrrocinia]EKS9905774.1 XRE family transcriptional regulator [Burkholderia pyrrocinia]
MTYEEFQRQLGKAGLTVREFAELIRMNRNSITNCASKGEVPSHLAVISALMGEMAEYKVDFRHVLARVEIEPKKPRGGGARGQFGRNRQSDLFVADPKQDPVS